jgi:type IV pilus assembly protein PilV
MSRMQAVNLASDLGDRIRANRTAADAYAFDGTATLTDPGCIGTSVTCSPADMATHDLFVWKRQIAGALPGSPIGTVTILDTTNPRTYVIAVSWTEPGQADALSYQMRVQI